MKLTYIKNHPNGFKIILACHLNNVKLKELICVEDVRNGAQLEVENKLTSQMLDSNSAVLKIFQFQTDISFYDLEWLDWELNLQEELIPFLQIQQAGKEENSLSKILDVKLEFLNSSLPPLPGFFYESVSSTDVVLYGTLMPLLIHPSKSKLIENKVRLYQYLQFLRSQPHFQEAEILYYGESSGSSPLHFDLPERTIPSTKNLIFDLLKISYENVSKGTVQTLNNLSVTTVNERNNAREISEAIHQWESKIEAVKRLPLINSPVIPVNGARNIMITSALPYVNNVPHLGNIIGSVLSADCFAKFCRIRGDNVIYICGTDEYGTATETKALSEGITPQQICDKYHKIHLDIYNWFDIDFDFFGRTTTESQTKAAQSIFWNLHENNLIEKKSVEQLFCGKCERFLADRFVEGICPYPSCGFEDARGDQCDACGKLVNAIELIRPRCKLCSSTPSLKSSTHLFFKLQNVQTELENWLSKVALQWTNNAKMICESWIRDGLKERCITRDLKWGTPVPLDGFTDKVFYVWYDAPIGYISMTMEYCNDEWQNWWKNPDNVSYYQFMGKDNVPFHGIIFPSCLLGTKEKWTMASNLIATEYLNYEDGKFSKSRGIGVFGDQAKETGICSDVWRFYLLYIRPESQDSAFSWSDLQSKNNNELLNNLGNFVNRSLKFVYQFYKGIVPEASPRESDFKFMTYINQELDKYTESIGSCKLRDGIRYLLSITRLGNQYIQENEPFKLIKADRSTEDKRRGATVINISTNVVGLVALLLQPYMPKTSKKISSFLNYPETLRGLPKYFGQYIKPGHLISQPFPLIQKITDEEIELLRKRFSGLIKDENFTLNKPFGNSHVELDCSATNVAELEKRIAEQGSKVRDLKSQGVSKEDIAPEIRLLLQLKEKLAIAQGNAPSFVNTKSKSNKNKL